MIPKFDPRRSLWQGMLFPIVVLASFSLSTLSIAQIGFPGEQQQAESGKELDTSLEATIARGKTVYDDRCAFCHRADGMGVPEAFPPLVAGAKFNAEPSIIDPLKKLGLYENGAMKLGTVDTQIDVVLHGIPGTRMFAFDTQLTTQEAADVVTYIRNGWTNKSGDLVTRKQIEAALGK